MKHLEPYSGPRFLFCAYLWTKGRTVDGAISPFGCFHSLQLGDLWDGLENFGFSTGGVCDCSVAE